MLDRARRFLESFLPGTQILARVERSRDPASGICFFRLLDADGHPIDGRDGLDGLARTFQHRGKRVRFAKSVRAALGHLAEFGGRWTPDRGFAVRDEDYPDAVRALQTIGELQVTDAPGEALPNVDARPLEPCETVELVDDEVLRRDVAFADPDGGSRVEPGALLGAPASSWVHTASGWNRRPRESRAEIETLAAEAAAPLLRGDAVPHFLAKQLLEAKQQGRQVILLERASAARVIDGAWMPRARVDAKGDRIHIDLSVQAGGEKIPWRQIESSRGRKYIPIRKDTWVANDPVVRKRTEEALEEIPQLRNAASGGFEAPAYALPVVQEVFSPIGLIDLTDSARRLFEQLRDFTKIESVPIPKGLRAELRPYQRAGLDWLCFLRRYGFGGVLADDMGLGKTVQTCAALLAAAERGETDASLVVCPASVQMVWAQEISRWCEGLDPLLLGPGDRARYLKAPPPRTVAIVSYPSVARSPELFQRPVWNYVVLDEAHRVKNHTTATAGACKGLLARHKVALTGTPIQNRLKELWALFDSIMPGYLGEAGTFTRRFATPIEREKNEDAASRLRQRIDPFKLRRLKTQVATELPPILRQVRQVCLLESQRKIYDNLRNEVHVAEVLRELRGHGNPLRGLEKLLRLRQACAHPRLVVRNVPLRGTSAKLEELADILDESLAEEHKVLVFTQWTQMAALIREMLDEERIAHVYLDGTVPVATRAELVKAFQSPSGPPVMVISLLAGGEGITLTQADTVVMYDRWWNPAVEEQAIARAYRIGQQRPVTAYVLEALDTIEQRLAKLLAGKQALAEDLVRVDDLEKRITREQLIAVLEEELGAASQQPTVDA